MTFQQALDAVRAALGRADWADAQRLLDLASSLANDEAQHAFVVLQRAGISVLRGDADPDLRVFRENVVRRHSARHVESPATTCSSTCSTNAISFPRSATSVRTALPCVSSTT